MDRGNEMPTAHYGWFNGSFAKITGCNDRISGVKRGNSPLPQRGWGGCSLTVQKQGLTLDLLLTVALIISVVGGHLPSSLSLMKV